MRFLYYPLGQHIDLASFSRYLSEEHRELSSGRTTERFGWEA